MRLRSLAFFSLSLVAALSAGCSAQSADTGTTSQGGAAGTPGTAGSSAGDTSVAGASTTTTDAGSSAGGASAGTANGGDGGTTTSAAGTGGAGASSTGGSGGATPQAGAGGSSGGSSAGSGGSGGAGITWLSQPVGKIPNVPSPASAIGEARVDWQKGVLSASMEVGHHLNQPTVLNGYLLLNGNEEFFFMDISDIKNIKEISNFKTPNRCATCGQKGEGEAESHQVSFARYGNRFYEVTTGGVGVNIWDVSDQKKPTHLKAIPLQGIKYDDFTGAVWGMAWQGDTIYIGSTDQGVDILDAKDPTNVKWVKRLSTTQIGGISAGPVFAIGNVLVVTTPKGSGGIATLDISDPLNPTLMQSIKPPQSYIGSFYRHYVFFNNSTPPAGSASTETFPGVRAWDVLTDPYSFGTATKPYGELVLASTQKAEYQSFSDDHLFLGHLHAAGVGPGASKIDVSDPKKMVWQEMIYGRKTSGQRNDDQFTLALGSMLVLCDDELSAGYAGGFLAAQSVDADTKPPVVDTIIPRDKSTVPVTSRVGITFSDNIELVTVTGESFIVRPVGGQPLPGKWGMQLGILTFDPDQDFLPATTYEVVLKKGGIADLVGNALAAEFKSTFTTQAAK